jgi:hypothetical protein
MKAGRIIRVVDGNVAVGWRAWTVQQTHDGIRLGSIIHEAAWEPGQLADAQCVQPHGAPNPDCNCGFHAARDPVDVFSYLRGRDELTTICRVLGEVLLSGRIVETDIGWRAERAYPFRLYIEDSEIASALEHYGVTIGGNHLRWTTPCASTPTLRRRSQSFAARLSPTRT